MNVDANEDQLGQRSGGNTAGRSDCDVFKVGVRVPPFWPDEPELWFSQLEGQFILSGITQDTTKFYYALSQLDPCYATHVKDVIRSPPALGKFEKLKDELIKRLSASKEKKLKQLFMHEEMGDRKPSQFLRHLRNLAGPSVADDILQTLWTGRLPHALQTVVASQAKLPLDDIAELADRVHEIAAPSPLHVASASASSSSTYDKLNDQICALTKQVAKLTSEVYRRSRPQAVSQQDGRRARSRQRSQSRNRQPPPGHSHCWYHFNFGTKARKCNPPCNFSENSMGSRK